jgi:hypothetical protein
MSPRLPFLIAFVLTAMPCASLQAAPESAAVSFVESAPGDDGMPPVTAIALRRPAGATSPQAAPTDVVVLIDTSASQVGDFRQRAGAAVAGLLEKARPADRFRLVAVDVACEPLGNDFAPAAGTENAAAIESLEARAPLGSTDFTSVIREAAELFETSQAPRSIVYVGDGPGLGGVDQAEFQGLLETLRAKRISCSSIGVGPQVNWPCLAAVAHATGGMLLVPDESVSPRDAGSRLGALAVEPVWWPEDVMLSSNLPDARVRMLPRQLPPLRRDRDSIILVEGPLDRGRLEMSLEDSIGAGSHPAAVDIPSAVPRQENAFLVELARNARESDGAFLPLLGREGLDLARTAIRGEAATLAALSRQAEAAGAHGPALRLAVASLRRDPDNVDASLVRSVALRRLQGEGDPADEEPAEEPVAEDNAAEEDAEPPAAELEPLPAPKASAGGSGPAGSARAVREPVADPRELAEFNAMRRVRGQQLEQETAVRLRNARQLMAVDPDKSRSDLKDLQRAVLASDDLDPAMRDRLARQIEISVRESIVRSREKAECELAAERSRAIGRERMRLDDELRRREDRIKQLTERYNALVEEGIRIGYNRAERYPAVLGDNTRHESKVIARTEPPTTVFTEAERFPAEQLAEEAPDLYANHPVPMPARVIGRMAPIEARIHDYVAENWRTRRDQERGFMDSLHLVDVAAIPMPDEPPILYPSASRWAELTKKREKYKSVDLANPGSNEKKIYDSLDKPVENLDFSETPLRDVIAQIQDSQGIPVQIDAKALEDAGLDLEAPITRNVSGISLRSALRLLLGDLDLTYLIKDEVLLITTKDKAAENLVVKVYPVADLVMPVNPSSGMNPFQTGGGLGGAGGVNSGMGGMGGGGMGGMGGGGMGGGMFQISDARARIGRNEKTSLPKPVEPSPRSSGEQPETVEEDDISLPASIVGSTDIRGAVRTYLAPRGRGENATPADDRELAARLARLRATAAELGKQGDFERAADLISAAIAAGYPEPWMYEALAVALDAAGRPKREVERALLSAADFASSPADLLALANYLARFGSERQAIRVCRQVTTLDPANREAYALAMSLAARTEDAPALRWSCAGVLTHEWPADQQDIATRAARLSKSTIERLREEGKTAEADAFEASIDEALVRDIELELSWNGDADVDLVVEEPTGTVCSLSSPRSTSGGMLLGDTAAAVDLKSATQRERYVAAKAFPGTYWMLVRRATGKVAADTVTAELTLNRGTDREQKLRRQIPLGANEVVFNIDLPEGRRREPLLDAQVAHDVAVQQDLGRAILAQQLGGIADPAAAASLSQSRRATGGQPIPGMPFFRSGAVGYQPVITTLPEGTNMFATAVVSADRRYVRVTVTPLFSGVGQVTQFNFSGGGAQGTGQGGGAGGGGAGGGGMGGGGMGGGGMGGGGMGGGMGGGGMGMGMCWVAREVYGPANPRWLIFRGWLLSEAPTWLVDLYAAHGEDFAAWIHDKPALKAMLRLLMDCAIAAQAP